MVRQMKRIAIFEIAKDIIGFLLIKYNWFWKTKFYYKHVNLYQVDADKLPGEDFMVLPSGISVWFDEVPKEWKND